LLYGDAGTGKTYSAVQLAKMLSIEGRRVIFIDPEFGAEKELLKLSDKELQNIELKITPDWVTFRDAVLSDDDCYIKIIDGLSEGLELFKRHLMKKFIAQGFFIIGEKEFPIKDLDTFTLPWGSYPKLYDEVKSIVYIILQHKYYILATMHPLKASEGKAELGQDIQRKFDTVLEMRRKEGDTINWYAIIKKNRGREDTTTNAVVKTPDIVLNTFKKKLEDEK